MTGSRQFGSRARGEQTPLSDYDLLVVKPGHVGERIVVEWPVQLFVFSLAEVSRELEHLNTIVLDAFTEGTLLCGDREVFERFRAEAFETVARKKITKTSAGWVPKHDTPKRLQSNR